MATWSNSRPDNSGYGGISNIVLYLLFCVTTILMVVRFWIFYYDSQLNQFNKNKGWRMAIDPKKEFTNWFVDHEHNLGNWYSLFKLTIITPIFEATILMCLSHLSGNHKTNNNDKRNSKHWNKTQNNLSFLHNSSKFLLLGDMWFAICIFILVIPIVNLIHKLQHFTKQDMLAIGSALIYIAIVYEQISSLRMTSTICCLHFMFYMPVLLPKKITFKYG